MTEFIDVQFMTAVEKARLAKQWERFLASNMHADKFTKAIYHHLMQHCGHIAHYDRGGFYHTQFAQPQARAQFIAQFLDDHESGRLYWGACEDYRDIGTVMYHALAEHRDRIMALAENAATENLREDIARRQSVLDAMEGRA